MSTFLHYDPHTNTIEKRNAGSPQKVEIPYLLNLMQYNIGTAIRSQAGDQMMVPMSGPNKKKKSHHQTSNTMDSKTIGELVKEREIMKNSGESQNGLINVEDIYEQPTRDRDDEQDSEVLPEFGGTAQQQFRDTKKRNNFQSVRGGLIQVDDINEDDFEGIPESPVRHPTVRYGQKSYKPERSHIRIQDDVEPEYSENNTNRSGAPQFTMMSPTNPILNYKPEDYSINERILNARYVQQEQEKTKKFLMDKISKELEEIDLKANQLERDFEYEAQNTEDLEKRTKEVFEEVKRKKLEMEAQKIMRKIDEAVDYGQEPSDGDHQKRFDQLKSENQVIYDEINRLMSGGTYGLNQSATREVLSMNETMISLQGGQSTVQDVGTLSRLSGSRAHGGPPDQMSTTTNKFRSKNASAVSNRSRSTKGNASNKPAPGNFKPPEAWKPKKPDNKLKPAVSDKKMKNAVRVDVKSAKKEKKGNNIVRDQEKFEKLLMRTKEYADNI